jgi:hypothetical protein
MFASDTQINDCIRDNPGKNAIEIRHILGLANTRAVQRIMDKRAEDPGLTAHCDANGIPVHKVGHYWAKIEKYSTFIKRKADDSWQDVMDDMIAEMQLHSPVYPEVVYSRNTDGHLLVVDPCDIHFNKLSLRSETGESYNTKIATQRVKDGIQGLIDKSKSFQIDHILFIMGNDILNTDNHLGSTTKGTHQDTDSLWHQVYMVAFKSMVEAIEKLAAIAPVTVQFNPSNHDVILGFTLAQGVAIHFRNCSNIVFNVNPSHRKYFEYGKNLIGTTHGDGAKPEKLPFLLAEEAPKSWAKCPRRYVYMHHVHHKISRDYGSVCVESLRSPSGADGWHHRNGFQHAPKAMEAFLHHPKYGQIARFTHFF